MRRLVFGQPLTDFAGWVKNALQQIEQASGEDVEAIVRDFVVTGMVTEQRTFNAETATVDDLRNVIATLITDIQKGGQKRSL